MPWPPSAAQKKDKDADTPAKQRKWAKIANAVLKKTGDEALAIRTASRAVESLQRRPLKTLEV